MGSFIKKLEILFTACRGYSLPISIMSWLVPFLYASIHSGNRFFGLLALIGIMVSHMGTNIFDDVIDYAVAKKKIEKGLLKDFDFQSGKCLYIMNGVLSLKQYFIISMGLFFVAFLIAMFFYTLIGIKLLYIIIPTIILCLLYPILGRLGLGEIIVAIVFSPLLYSGVYLVMTGNFSGEILILSISTGFLVVAVLHNHMVMDYKVDETERKITLCRLCKNPKNAIILLGVFISLAYLNLIYWIFINKLSIYFLLPILTIPIGIKLIKEIKKYAFDKNKEEFISNFLLVEKLLSAFTILLCISIVVDKCI